MLHACVRRFDVMGTVKKFLGTKHPLNRTDDIIVRYADPCFDIIVAICTNAEDIYFLSPQKNVTT